MLFVENKFQIFQAKKSNNFSKREISFKLYFLTISFNIIESFNHFKKSNLNSSSWSLYNSPNQVDEVYSSKFSLVLSLLKYHKYSLYEKG